MVWLRARTGSMAFLRSVSHWNSCKLMYPIQAVNLQQTESLMTSSNLKNQNVGITRLRKRVYPKPYKVRIVNPDGSSYMVRHPEPLGILRLPIDVDNLSEEEKALRTKRLRDEKAVQVEKFDDSDVKFDKRAALARFSRKKT